MTRLRWPRSRFATLLDRLDRLDALGGRVLAFDPLFAEPDRYSPANLARDPALAGAFRRSATASEFDKDARFAASMEGRGGWAWLCAGAGNDQLRKSGMVEIGDAPGTGLSRLVVTTPLAPPLGKAAAGIGSTDVAPGAASGVVRKVPLLWQTPSDPLPGLAVEALRLAMGQNTIILDGVPGVRGVVQFRGIGALAAPIDAIGALWMRYRRDDPALYVSAADLVSDEASFATRETALRPRLEGRIVFVGTSAAELLDIRTTALGERGPGGSIHAQIVEQILLGETLRRDGFIAGLELLAFVALG
ncbi:CHASE2 domain-containing protein [Tropicimonas sp. TH_r6]|uniref:CHASE2 domain-containing protein n=1 Tax=Tropicimonas sp. TH_r6 TaxID=3082085 RepID=UPI002955C942|nr:CHASE2 domain-containing protein [Tropicimonas sp. TH_r6]MDV7143952.1 CHASE2 domain-containing protein [Tropicimonas sp. TH_r6]